MIRWRSGSSPSSPAAATQGAGSVGGILLYMFMALRHEAVVRLPSNATTIGPAAITSCGASLRARSARAAPRRRCPSEVLSSEGRRARSSTARRGGPEANSSRSTSATLSPAMPHRARRRPPVIPPTTPPGRSELFLLECAIATCRAITQIRSVLGRTPPFASHPSPAAGGRVGFRPSTRPPRSPSGRHGRRPSDYLQSRPACGQSPASRGRALRAADVDATPPPGGSSSSANGSPSCSPRPPRAWERDRADGSLGRRLLRRGGPGRRLTRERPRVS